MRAWWEGVTWGGRLRADWLPLECPDFFGVFKTPEDTCADSGRGVVRGVFGGVLRVCCDRWIWVAGRGVGGCGPGSCWVVHVPSRRGPGAYGEVAVWGGGGGTGRWRTALNPFPARGKRKGERGKGASYPGLQSLTPAPLPCLGEGSRGAILDFGLRIGVGVVG